MLDSLVAIAYATTNIFSIVQVVGSYRWPTVTRVVFFLIFGIAAYVNTQTVLDRPWVYQSYADYAIPAYSWFILGPFEAIIKPMVLSIAIGQVCIALSMFMKGLWFRVGCLGGIVFCVAIAPLGMGAAFPATLLLAFAFYRLYTYDDQETVGEVITHNHFPLPAD
ncbi:MAG: hypothetical protein EOO39_01340 [Cytophagaceae bacterium]|nr:MAG: hypothetical protein EOO39_01340 [Cytophagaceae bacterium]